MMMKQAQNQREAQGALKNTSQSTCHYAKRDGGRERRETGEFMHEEDRHTQHTRTVQRRGDKEKTVHAERKVATKEAAEP